MLLIKYFTWCGELSHRWVDYVLARCSLSPYRSFGNIGAHIDNNKTPCQGIIWINFSRSLRSARRAIFTVVINTSNRGTTSTFHVPLWSQPLYHFLPRRWLYPPCQRACQFLPGQGRTSDGWVFSLGTETSRNHIPLEVWTTSVPDVQFRGTRRPNNISSQLSPAP